jgi:hypothetical protein
MSIITFLSLETRENRHRGPLLDTAPGARPLPDDRDRERRDFARESRVKEDRGKLGLLYFIAFFILPLPPPLPLTP